MRYFKTTDPKYDTVYRIYKNGTYDFYGLSTMDVAHHIKIPTLHTGLKGYGLSNIIATIKDHSVEITEKEAFIEIL